MPVFTEEPQEEEQPKQFDEVRFLISFTWTIDPVFLLFWLNVGRIRSHKYCIIKSKNLHNIMMFELSYIYIHLVM